MQHTLKKFKIPLLVILAIVISGGIFYGGFRFGFAKGEVVKIADFGVFVALNPFTDGMAHISELAPFRVERISDIIKEGMIVPVKIIKIDSERDKISLSIKEADKDFFKK